MLAGKQLHRLIGASAAAGRASRTGGQTHHRVSISTAQAGALLKPGVVTAAGVGGELMLTGRPQMLVAVLRVISRQWLEGLMGGLRVQAVSLQTFSWKGMSKPGCGT